jgi:hypothetical protein
VSGRVIVGVDPGGRMTGIVARRGDVYLGHELVIRKGRGSIPGPAYLQRVAERVNAWYANWTGAVLAIEGVQPPWQRSRRHDARSDGGGGLIALGKVVAALELYFPEAVVVMPDRHGRNLLAAYPAPLVGRLELERLNGDGPLQHCRSAWDVAGRAQTLLHQAANSRQPRPSAGAVSSVVEGPSAAEGARLHRSREALR